jgi:hypothetical protein
MLRVKQVRPTGSTRLTQVGRGPFYGGYLSDGVRFAMRVVGGLEVCERLASLASTVLVAVVALEADSTLSLNY